MLRRTVIRGALAITTWSGLLLGGCLAVRSPEPGAAARVAPGEGIVIGSIRVSDRGIEITPWKRELDEILSEDPVIHLALFHIESGRKRPDVAVSPDGRFEWILPVGTYLLYHTPSVDPPFNEPLAAFRVTPGSQPCDLGELDLDVSVDRQLSWKLATYSLLGVETSEGNGETVAWYLARHPGTEGIRQGAFVVDPELGGLFSHWSREACARILARHGMEIGPPEKR